MQHTTARITAKATATIIHGETELRFCPSGILELNMIIDVHVQNCHKSVNYMVECSITTTCINQYTKIFDEKTRCIF